MKPDLLACTKNSDVIVLVQIESTHCMSNEDYQCLNKNNEFICLSFISREKGKMLY